MTSPFLIAEMGASHSGSLEIAKATVRAAALAGADAFKLQTFDPERMVGNPTYEIASGPWKGRTLLYLYRQAHTPREWHAELFDLIRDHGMVPMSTPFDPDDVAFLESLGCPRYKVASFEIGHTELLEALRDTGKPVYVSTGMATAESIQRVVDLLGQQHHHAPPLTLLKCTSSYPAPASAANLATMADMRDRYRVHVGLSDHTRGVGVACAATMLGASAIEKHLTTTWGSGLDDQFAAGPGEWARFATAVRQTYQARGEVRYGPTDAESASQPLVRSLWWAEDLPAGVRVERKHVKVARPAGGLPPEALPAVLTRTLDQPVRAGEPVL